MPRHQWGIPTIIIDDRLRMSQVKKPEPQNEYRQSISQFIVPCDKLHANLTCRSSGEGVHTIYTHEADAFHSAAPGLV